MVNSAHAYDHGHLSVDDRLAIIDEQLAAIAESDPLDLADAHLGGDGLSRCAQLLRLRRQADAIASRGLHAFAASGQWLDSGSRSPKALIAGENVEPAGQIGGLLSMGAFTADHPAIAEVFTQGLITANHVRIWQQTYRTYPRLHSMLDAVETVVIEWMQQFAPTEFGRLVEDLIHQLDANAVDDAHHKREKDLHFDVTTTLDGYVHVKGLLDPVTGDLLSKTLESMRRAARKDDPDQPAADDRQDPAGASRSVAQRNVEALRRLLDQAIASGELPSVAGSRPRINVHLDLDSLTNPEATPGSAMAWLSRFGLPTSAITGSEARALACDATLAPLVFDRSGQVCAVLPTSRTIPAGLRAAVLARDEACRFPGCNARIDEVHHIVFHSQGGLTTRDNLIGLCYFHHRLIHDHRWRITGHPDGEVTFSHPFINISRMSNAPGPLGRERRKTTREFVERVLGAPPRGLLPRELAQDPDPPF